MENINLEIQKLRTKKIPNFELRKDVLEIKNTTKKILQDCHTVNIKL